MKKLNTTLFTLLTGMFLPLATMAQQPKAAGPTPNKYQVAWQKMEYYAFIHFSMNTFTDIEWGYGDKDPKLFNPSDLDCRQWARTAKEAGMKGIILTAKHHDGFCLWPSKYTDYSVKNSPWKNGKGDLVKELAEACKEYGLKLGIYLSPWDRNNADYGKPEYITYFRNQLRELLSNYGDIFEVWFDGANGGTGYYGGARETRNVDRKTYYDWQNTFKIVRELQPAAMIFSDGGPDVRWCGDEEGWVGETNWSLLRRDEVWPGYPNYQELRYGHENGTHWVPAEVNVSMRPGWFYHQSEDHKVKTVPELVDIYYQSIGRNGTLLINFPVDKRGLIHEQDAENIIAMKKTIDAELKENLASNKRYMASNIRNKSSNYSVANAFDKNANTYWATDDNVRQANLIINFGEKKDFNRFLIQEYTPLGQRVKSFSIEAKTADGWKEIAKGTTIGYKRILRFPTVSSNALRLNINDAKACPLITEIGVFNAPKMLSAPSLSRNKQGLVTISVDDKENKVFYTLDGTNPDKNNNSYNAAFSLTDKAVVKAVSFDPSTQKYSPVSTANFDISRKKWKLIDSDAITSDLMFDGNPATTYHYEIKKTPAEITVDLDSVVNLRGIKYMPDQSRYPKGIIFGYEIFCSTDGQQWKKVLSGEFSNIKNNPLEQTLNFPAIQTRYIRFKAVSTTTDDKELGIAELDIITE